MVFALLIVFAIFVCYKSQLMYFFEKQGINRKKALIPFYGKYIMCKLCTKKKWPFIIQMIFTVLITFSFGMVVMYLIMLFSYAHYESIAKITLEQLLYASYFMEMVMAFLIFLYGLIQYYIWKKLGKQYEQKRGFAITMTVLPPYGLNKINTLLWKTKK